MITVFPILGVMLHFADSLKYEVKLYQSNEKWFDFYEAGQGILIK